MPTGARRLGLSTLSLCLLDATGSLVEFLNGGPVLKIDLSCNDCSDNQFSIEEASRDDCVIVCRGCSRRLGTLRQLKRQIERELVKRLSG